MKKHSSTLKGHSGFTLIELLVVIAIIAILSAITIVALNSARGKAINSRVDSEMSDLGAQLELFYDDNGQYLPSGQTNSAVACSSEPFGLGIVGPLTDDAQTIITAINKDVASMTCTADAQSWVVQANFNGSGTWCSDSNGVSNSTTTAETGTSPYHCQ